jgi:hypothetical protein
VSSNILRKYTFVAFRFLLRLYKFNYLMEDGISRVWESCCFFLSMYLPMYI